VSRQQTILVVDDIPENIDVLSGILSPEYKVKAALGGERALAIARAEPKPDMVLLDIMMPEMDGYEVIRLLKVDPRTRDIPVIFVTARTEDVDEERGFKLGAVDYITKPVSPPIVSARVRTQLALYQQNRELDRRVEERTHQLRQTRLQIIQRLGRAAEYKDNETGMHVIRMSYYSRLLAESLSISDEWTELVFNAAPMHDIGKIGIPDRILLKAGRLDEMEWALMQRHTIYGAEIMGEHESELIQMASEVALTHHEQWNGKGYPQCLAGEDIPLAGRIVAIADVFDALTSDRPYKRAWTVDEAMALIEKGAGEHFDPTLVPIFKSRLPEVLKVREQYAEDAPLADEFHTF
jgi:putative two-component system response regulator